MDPAWLREDYLQRQRRLFRNAVLRIHHDLAPLSRDDAAPPVEALVYLYAWHWLRVRVPAVHHPEILSASRNPEHAYLTPMLLESPDGEAFVQDYLDYWHARGGEDPRAVAVRRWLDRHGGSAPAVAALLRLWRMQGWFCKAERDEVRRMLRHQRQVHQQVLGALDRTRLALLDALPDPGPVEMTFPKVGLVPRMACGAGCRHCQFVWRGEAATPLETSAWFRRAMDLSPHLLFTGGDLSPELDLFRAAIRTLPEVVTFALILNGTVAKSPEAARAFLESLESALDQRPPRAQPAGVVLQVSLDEWHQEIFPGRGGVLRERIPVAHVAHLLRAAVSAPRVRVVLLHKQERLNLSQEFFRQGVVARLGRTLRGMGAEMHVVGFNHAPGGREDPAQPGREAPMIAEVAFHLHGHPDTVFFLVSGLIDGYGRAALLDPGTVLDGRRALQAWLAGEPWPEGCDTDPMLWRDGRVTLFHAPHLALGSLAEEAMGLILARWRKDPLRRALGEADPALLELYRRWGGDGEALLTRATSVPHLLWLVTEEADARLFMTRALLERDAGMA